IMNGRVGVEFHKIIGHSQIHIKITNTIPGTRNYRIRNYGNKLGLVQITLLDARTEAKRELVKASIIPSQSQMMRIGKLKSRLGMVPIGVIKYGGSKTTTFPYPKMGVQRLHIGSLVHTEPLLPNSCPNFSSLANSSHRGVYQIIIIRQIVKIHRNTFLGNGLIANHKKRK